MGTPEEIAEDILEDTPEEIVGNYIAYLDDVTYLNAAIAKYGIQTLAKAAVNLLDDLDEESVLGVLPFIRDVSIGVFPPDTTHSFRDAWPNVGLFEALDRCLTAPNFQIRSQAVYTFGKLGFMESQERLSRLFDERKDVDPLLVPSLMFELRWFTCQNQKGYWERISALAKSPESLTRWAALGCLEDSHSRFNRPLVQAEELLTQLEQDSCPYVQKEAAYLHAQWRWRIQHRRLKKSERKAQEALLEQKQQRIKALEPALNFWFLRVRFSQHYRNADYTIQDVLDFLKMWESSSLHQFGNAG